MALLTTPESSRGIWGSIKDALGLFGSTNKTEGGEGFGTSAPIDEYESNLSETKVLQLTAEWKRRYQPYYEPIKKSQELAFDYWVGKQRQDLNQATGKDNGQTSDNIIFQSVETFLPIATRANPDPLVNADEGDAGQALAHDLRAALIHEADTQKLRRKLARGTRHWILYRIGAWKVSWDVTTKSIKTEVINPKNFIFDKDGYIDEGGFFCGEYIGERKKATAERLTEMFPKKADIIKRLAQDKMGTKLDYIEWWYCNTDVFFTLEDYLLGKYKNPNWNYDGKTTEKDPETGAEQEVEIQGRNHFKEPRSPYVFLAIFNTGQQPHDETSLILQNISIQDLINRRWRQIDKNVERMNNGMVVSGKSFTEEQASQAASALARGMAIRVPDGNVNGAVVFPPMHGLPGDVFRNLEDARNELNNIFGTSGSTPEGVESQKSVRGKILVNQLDSSRIGGGITEYLEQVADSIYNLWVQMMFVYYDEEHYIATAGIENGTELITLKNDRFPFVKTLTITVKEGSLIPKDPLTQRNEAMDLWSANAIDPRTLFKRLDFADPNEATKQLLLWQLVQKGALPPQAYIPDFQAPPQPLPQQGVGGPAVNPIGGAETQNPVPMASPEAVQAQGKQLIQSMPIR